jgi:hypothetical protein
MKVVSPKRSRYLRVFYARKPAVMPIVVGSEAAQTPMIHDSNTLAFNGGFVILWNSNWDCTGETPCFPWDHQLNVCWHCILGHSALHPNLVQFIAGWIDCHAGSIVINTRKHKVNSLFLQAALSDSIDEIGKAIISGYVEIVCFNPYFRVNALKRLLSSLHLRQAHLSRSKEQSKVLISRYLFMLASSTLS